jgi:hypothetical protein
MVEMLARPAAKQANTQHVVVAIACIGYTCDHLLGEILHIADSDPNPKSVALTRGMAVREADAEEVRQVGVIAGKPLRCTRTFLISRGTWQSVGPIVVTKSKTMSSRPGRKATLNDIEEEPHSW